MATNERTFQAELLKAMHALGWHAFKVTSITHGGLPDLYVKAPKRPGTWIELKYEAWTESILDRGIPVNLSKLQRYFMDRELAMGGRIGALVCVGKPAKFPTMWSAHLTCNPMVDRLWFGFSLVATRERGDLWDVEKILDAF